MRLNRRPCSSVHGCQVSPVGLDQPDFAVGVAFLRSLCCGHGQVTVPQQGDLSWVRKPVNESVHWGPFLDALCQAGYLLQVPTQKSFSTGFDVHDIHSPSTTVCNLQRVQGLSEITLVTYRRNIL